MNFFTKLKKRFAPTPFEKAIKKWFKDKGDQTLRLNYELTESSVVFDLGGYEGQWSSDIYNKYGCTIYIFEPVKKFYQEIVARFEGNNHIKVFNFGLANSNTSCDISLSADGSSIYSNKEGNYEQITLVRAIDFLREHKIEKIDLMKINIEGGEYDLLDHLLNAGYVENITDIQVQFHDCPELPNSFERMHNIQRELAKTHILTYQYYPFVWENWHLVKKAIITNC